MIRQIVIILLILTPSLFPQIGNDRLINFQLAVSRYGSYQYEEALKLFTGLSSSGSGSYVTASLLFKGKTELRLKKYDDARRTIVAFLDTYPQSRYKDEARLTLAKLYFESGDIFQSLRELSYLIQDAGSGEYRKQAKDAAGKIILSELNTADVEKLLITTNGDKSKPFLLLMMGKAYLKKMNKLEADAAFLEILDQYPESDEQEQAAALYKQKDVKPETKIELAGQSPVIAVLLPLTNNGSDDQSSPIKEILEGIKYSVSEFNNNNDTKVGLLIRNTDNNPAKIEEIRNELQRIASLKLIIGPVFSDEVRAALRVFNKKDIAVISPTATDNDLSELNEYFFQANPNFTVRGKAMAQYIYFVENKRKIGVLNAAEGYSPLLALSFTSEFERLGGEIVTRETYLSQSFKIDDQIRRIAGFGSSIEGLYIPLTDKTDATVILNEMLMNNLDVPVYGNQDWFYSKGYSNFPGLIDRLTFTSDHFTDYNNPEYQEFAKNFIEKSKIDANRNVLYGYDITRFIMNVVVNWNESPSNIKGYLESGRSVDGYHNNISFDGQRVNNFINIIRYRDGVFELVDKFKTGAK